MDKETKERIADFFEGFELVEFLRLPIEDIVDRFEDEIEYMLEEIEELMNVRHK